ncbi:hypothetical protein AB0J21_11845 [Streptomyces sp. NPDC049954]|uniref:hypothetical protein n=1 Tax=Streptomyces sp. NPDC049954 TaxID=3155779 RepID=UPI003412ABAC
MAVSHTNSAAPAVSWPMAKDGFGKRLAPGQDDLSEGSFAHLPAREAAIAGFIERLPQGAAIGYKALASVLPDYGQQACRTALKRLSRIGHLRWVREHVTVQDGTRRWITRTYFSRTARDVTWWAEFVRSVRGVEVGERGAPRAVPTADTPPVGTLEAPATPVPGVQPETRETRETPVAPVAPVTTVPGDVPQGAASGRGAEAAYRLLARLGRVEPRLSLAERECRELAPLLAVWFERGAGEEKILDALTRQLPTPVHSAGALVRSRLERKVPPEAEPFRETVLDAQEICADCHTPDTVVRLVGGVCEECAEDLYAEDAEDAEEAGCAGGLGGAEGGRARPAPAGSPAPAPAPAFVPDTFLSPAGPGEEPTVRERVDLLRELAGIGAMPN